MDSIWMQSVCRSLEQSLEVLATAVRDCTGELWETPMWEVADPGHDLVGGQELVGGVAERRARVQRHSTPWGVAWHALECIDYDLAGEFGPWAPPLPFTGHPHWRDITSLPVAWSQPELLGYIDYCRERVRTTLEGMTGELGARPLPSAHRYGGQPHAWVISALVGHTSEHAAQISYLITAAGSTPGSGDGR